MHRNQKFIYNMAFVVLQSAHSLKGVIKPVYDDHVTLNSWDQPGGLQS